jgi:hypothetical protein
MQQLVSVDHVPRWVLGDERLGVLCEAFAGIGANLAVELVGLTARRSCPRLPRYVWTPPSLAASAGGARV